MAKKEEDKDVAYTAPKPGGDMEPGDNAPPPKKEKSSK